VTSPQIGRAKRSVGGPIKKLHFYVNLLSRD
jgi:hypothetical protein